MDRSSLSVSRDLVSILGEKGDRIVLSSRQTLPQTPSDDDSAALQLQLTLDRIEAALGRLDAGEYGLCLSCGGQIGYVRLDQDPSRALCGRCAAR